MDDPVVEAAEAGPTPERPGGAGTALPAQVLEDLVEEVSVCVWGGGEI